MLKFFAALSLILKCST